MSMRLLGAWVLVATVAASLVGCPPSVSDLNAAVERARACNEGDTCQLEGATACTCPTAVNSSQAAMIRQLAAHVTCSPTNADAGADGGTIQCPVQINPRCVNMHCVADRP